GWSVRSRSVCAAPRGSASIRTVLGFEEAREIRERRVELRLHVVGELALFRQELQCRRVLRLEKRVELRLVAPDGRHGKGIEVAVGGGVDDRDLLLDRQRRELSLLHHLDEPLAPVELPARRRVEVGAELGEGGHLAVLRELEAERARAPL